MVLCSVFILFITGCSRLISNHNMSTSDSKRKRADGNTGYTNDMKRPKLFQDEHVNLLLRLAAADGSIEAVIPLLTFSN